MSSLKALDEVAVTVQSLPSGNRLLGYYTVHEAYVGNVSQADIAAQLSQLLPHYMLPAILMPLDTFPLTISGKLDKKALPIPCEQLQQYVAPQSQRQRVLCDAIAKSLTVGQVGLEDDFFALGGDSISAMQLGTLLRKAGWQLKPRQIFAHRQVKAMAEAMRALANEKGRENAAHVNISDEDKAILKRIYGDNITILPTLALQQGLIYQQLMSDGAGQVGNQYTFSTSLRLQGPLEVDKLRLALDALLVKYPQMAARFDAQSTDQVWQIITDKPQRWPLTYVQCDDKAQIKQYEIDAALQAFDVFADQPLVDALLIADGDEHVLILNCHHVVIDGWSLPLLLKDLFTAYYCNDSNDKSGEAGFVSGLAGFAKALSVLANRDTTKAKSHWQSLLQNVEPCSCYAPATTSSVKEYQLSLSVAQSERIRAWCRHHGLTINTLLQGLWAIQLMYMTGKQQVVFGSPVSGRSHEPSGISHISHELSQQVGLFSNTLPVVVKIAPQTSLIEQLRQLQQQQVELFEHEHIGLGDIQTLAGGQSLFDTLLVVENYPLEPSLFSAQQGLQLKSVENRGYTHYPLTLLVLPGEQLRILFEYRDTVNHVERIAERMLHVLEQLLAVKSENVESLAFTMSQLELITPSEQAKIDSINDTKHDIIADNLVDMIDTQVSKHSTQIALFDAKRRYTYQQMDDKVRQVSYNLIFQQVKPNDIVAVAVDRSCDLSIALQGVIKAGAAYLPIDNSYPDARISMMLTDANAALLLTTRSEVERFRHLTDTRLLLIDELQVQRPVQLPQVTAQDPAYVIFTSGSTGRPKGVLVSHGAIVNRLEWMQSEYPIGRNDVVLQKTPSSFDVSVWEFFWPLFTGAQLMMAPVDAHKDPQQLWSNILDKQVSTIHFVPSMLGAFVDYLQTLSPNERQACPLKQVFCSGEALSQDLVRQFSALLTVPLHNLYGPTEAAVDVSFCPALPQRFCQGSAVPIGLPVYNTQLYILDSQFKPVGIGIAGELYIAGAQLAIGYLGRADLTATRFIANPFVAGERMYRTGDVARYLDNGDIEYLGRCDDQLKIRGLRIELGEIEQQLSNIAGVKQAVVAAQILSQDSVGDQRQLVGYVQLHGSFIEAGDDFDVANCLTQLSATLPAHMVPVSIMVVEQFSLSANGKLDRKALPKPQLAQSNQPQRSAQAGAEAIIASVFAAILKLDNFGVNDSFFALGGHSLLAMRLAVQVRHALSIPVSVGQIMVSPTVAGLAQVLLDDSLRNDPEKAGFGQILPIRGGSGSPLICINPGSGFSWQYTAIAKYLTGDYPIIGLQSPRPDGAVAVSETMADAEQHYFNLLKQVQPHGPYRLMGYSFGGTVALALATRLVERGEEVAFVGLLDTYPPEGQEWKRPTKQEAEQEVAKEKRQFLAAVNPDGDSDSLSEEIAKEQDKMFTDIVANYDDTVRLLGKARTQAYAGKVAIVVAEQSLPQGWDVAQSWQPYVQDLHQYRFNYRHDDIIAPESLLEVGPVLDRLIRQTS